MQKTKLFLLLLIGFPFIGLLLNSCYLTKQSLGQFDLSWNQQPIADAIIAEKKPNRKKLLQEIPKVLSWGEKNLALKATQNYQGYYSTEKLGITFVVVAAEKESLTPYHWWFPIIGDVPYKGFFDLADATALQNKLKADGYDTWLFTAPAYSTLGWFQDPITTPMLKAGRYGLVETLLHEMAHATLYIEGNSKFNEQLASFVGRQGVKEYLSLQPGGATLIRQQEENSKRYKIFLDFVAAQIQTLKAEYQQAKATASRLQVKEKAMLALSEKYLELYPQSPPEKAEFNHARLLLFEMYQEKAPLFQKLFVQAAGHWPTFWNLAKIEGERQALP